MSQTRRIRGRGTASGEPGARENAGGAKDTAGDGNPCCAAEEIGEVGYERRELSQNQNGDPCLRQVENPTVPMPKSSSGASEARLRSGETHTDEESCGSGRHDAPGGTAHNDTDDDGPGPGEHRGGSREEEEEGGTSDRSGIGRHDAAGATEAAPGLPLDARNGHSCENRRRREGGESART